MIHHVNWIVYELATSI